MAYNLKQEMNKPERFLGGHRLCAGCGCGITVRAVLRALDPEDKAVIANATGCPGGLLLHVPLHRLARQLYPHGL